MFVKLFFPNQAYQKNGVKFTICTKERPNSFENLPGVPLCIQIKAFVGSRCGEILSCKRCSVWPHFPFSFYTPLSGDCSFSADSFRACCR